jgi:hypothetical protein
MLSDEDEFNFSTKYENDYLDDESLAIVRGTWREDELDFHTGNEIDYLDAEPLNLHPRKKTDYSEDELVCIVEGNCSDVAIDEISCLLTAMLEECSSSSKDQNDTDKICRVIAYKTLIPRFARWIHEKNETQFIHPSYLNEDGSIEIPPSSIVPDFSIVHDNTTTETILRFTGTELCMPASISFLSRVLWEQPPAAKVAAIKLLSKSQVPIESEVVQRIIVCLHSDSYYVRTNTSRAVIELHSRNYSVLPFLFRILSIPYDVPEMIRLVVLILAEIGEPARVIESQLASMLCSINQDLQSSAEKIVNRRDSDDSNNNEQADWPEYHSRRNSLHSALIFAIGKIGPSVFSFESLGLALGISLRYKFNDSGLSAIESLRHFRINARPLLIKTLHRGTACMKIAALRTIDVSGNEDPRLLKALFKCMVSPVKEVRDEALLALQRVETKDREFIISTRKLLKSKRWYLDVRKLHSMLRRAELMRLFRNIDFEIWREQFLVYWCIGRIDHIGRSTLGNAWGSRKLYQALSKMKAEGRLATLMTSENFIRKTIQELSSLFNQAPFSTEVWTKNEECPDLHRPVMNGNREEVAWTARGNAVWEYIDRFLKYNHARPLFVEK